MLAHRAPPTTKPHAAAPAAGAAARGIDVGGQGPILVIPYMWIGDLVRCHSVVRILKERWPDRPVDILASSLTAPLTSYMSGVRKGVIVDLPRRRLPVGKYRAMAEMLRQEHYETAIVLPRTWKAALAPFLAGISVRTGFVGEARFGLLNDLRWGERRLPRMVDRCGALALPPGTDMPAEWPMPELIVPAEELRAWRARRGLVQHRPVVALAPGANYPAKRWPAEHYGALARQLAHVAEVWVLGGPGEAAAAKTVVAASGGAAIDLTGNDLRDGILALAAADAAVCNDSGLLHVAAALGTPTIGVFGPTSPYHWAPLNPLAAIVKLPENLPCQPCHKQDCPLGHHLCMRALPSDQAFAAVAGVLEQQAGARDKTGTAAIGADNRPFTVGG